MQVWQAAGEFPLVYGALFRRPPSYRTCGIHRIRFSNVEIVVVAGGSVSREGRRDAVTRLAAAVYPQTTARETAEHRQSHENRGRDCDAAATEGFEHGHDERAG